MEHACMHGACAHVYVAWSMRACVRGMEHACMCAWHGACVHVYVAWSMRACVRGMEHACMWLLCGCGLWGASHLWLDLCMSGVNCSMEPAGWSGRAG